MTIPATTTWRKSPWSGTGGGNCVEIRVEEKAGA
jgi:hypothetical protein